MRQVQRDAVWPSNQCRGQVHGTRANTDPAGKSAGPGNPPLETLPTLYMYSQGQTISFGHTWFLSSVSVFVRLPFCSYSAIATLAPSKVLQVYGFRR